MKDRLEHYDSIQDLLGDLGYRWDGENQQFQRYSDGVQQIIPWKDLRGESVGTFVAKLKARGNGTLLEPMLPTASPPAQPDFNPPPGWIPFWDRRD